MTDRPDRLVKIILDKPRRLRFGNAALFRFEEQSGEDLLALAKTPKRFQSFRLQNILLWAGLRDDDPTLELEDINEILDVYQGEGGDRLKVVTTMMEALQKSEALAGKIEEKPKGGKEEGAPVTAAPAPAKP